jgi:tetratricopeptide (TPR) repeat protein
VGAVAGVVAVVALAAPAALRHHDAWRCEQAVSSRRFQEAATLCARAHRRTGDGQAAASTAGAHLALGDRREAMRWAALPEVGEHPRGVRVQGVLQKLGGDPEGARKALERALSLALEREEPSEAARAAHALAGLEWEGGRYSAAHQALRVSEREARRAGDAPAVALAELARGDIFRRLGDAEQADAAYRRAAEAARPWPADHAYALFKMGLALSERGAPERARQYVQQALSLAEGNGIAYLAFVTRLLLAEVHVRTGDPDEAERQLAALGADKQGDWDVWTVRARIALARADAGRAVDALARVDVAKLSPDERFDVESLRGEALAAAGRADEAVLAWSRAVETAEALSAGEPEHQGWVVARRRRPFDALFALYARRGDHPRAWDVVARYSLSEALSFTEAPEADVQHRVAAAEALRAAWPLSTPPGAGERLELPSARELLVLHEAEGRLWVGTRRNGVPHFHDAGPLEQFEPHLHRLLGGGAAPLDTRALGEAVWTLARLESSEVPLFVGATGRLRRVPFAGLTYQGRPWIALRPLARVPALLGEPSADPGPPGPPVVAGDPHGNLPHADEEVRAVAAQLGTAALRRSEVTREAVLSARGRRVLHLAAHAELSLEGGRLMLADGPLGAAEIVRHRPHARVVVLATCASNVGRDAAGADSLANAFLRAGSGAVLATLRSVPDEAARELVLAFYAHGGAQDPVRALARAQAQLVPTMPVSVWSAFVVSAGPSYERLAEAR